MPDDGGNEHSPPIEITNLTGRCVLGDGAEVPVIVGVQVSDSGQVTIHAMLANHGKRGEV